MYIANTERHNADESQDYKLGVDVFINVIREETIAWPIRGPMESDDAVTDFGLRMNVVYVLQYLNGSRCVQ